MYMRKTVKNKWHFNNLSIFSKLIILFLIIILMPLTVMFFQSQRTVNNVVVEQLSRNSLNSLQLVGNSVDGLFKRMDSIAMYINEDKAVKELLEQEVDNTAPAKPSGAQHLEKLTRINMFNNIIDNLAFNMVETKSYITFITKDGTRFSNWNYEGQRSLTYFDAYLGISGSTNLHWKGIEANYVDRDKDITPYVITLEKFIFDPTGQKQYGTVLISIPEDEISKLMGVQDSQQQRILFDKNGIIVSSTEKNWLNQIVTDISGLESPFSTKEGSRLLNNGDEEKLLTWYRFGNWTLLDISTYSSMNEAIGRAQNSLLLTCLIFGVIFILFSSIIARNLSNPIKKLTNSMLNADPEQFTEDAKTTRKDEIGILENSFITMKMNIWQLMQENQEKEQRKREDELKLLQAQISPHFLFNTLNTIRWAAINNNTQKVADMVFALLNLLRMTIVKGDELITIDEELETLKNYAAIFQMRHSVTFELIYQVEEKVRQYQIPKLLLQPLVENALIHGFEGIENGIIHIDGRCIDGHILLSVKDNGIGMELNEAVNSKHNTRKSKFSGMGINNVDERIKLYYGDDYGLVIQSTVGKGTLIEVWLPETMSLKEEKNSDD
jgi:Predicted signal transduction protein with a C-terminal ATPase domain